MRCQSLRLSIRTATAITLVFGVLTGSVVHWSRWKQRQAQYLACAADCARMENDLRRNQRFILGLMQQIDPRLLVLDPGNPGYQHANGLRMRSDEIMERLLSAHLRNTTELASIRHRYRQHALDSANQAEWFVRLRQKYERAAANPWSYFRPPEIGAAAAAAPVVAAQHESAPERPENRRNFQEQRGDKVRDRTPSEGRAKGTSRRLRLGAEA
jgi:hypothetical protein